MHMYKHVTLVALIALFVAGQVAADSHTDPDFNDDGIVNSSDYALFRAQWNTREGGPNWDAKFDLHSDGVINSLDYALFIANWNKTFPIPPSEVLSVCDRTGAVRDSIVALAPVSTCGDVTAAHLSAIDSLSLGGAGLTALKADDFSGLTGLTALNLQENQLSNLTNLEVLRLNDNALSGALPQSLTMLTMLESFYFGGGGLCAPSDAAFQTWLQGIEDVKGPTCSQ